MICNALGLISTPLIRVGLDAAGKSTILYKSKLNETVDTIPTVGFNVVSRVGHCWLGGEPHLSAHDTGDNVVQGRLVDDGLGRGRTGQD